MLFHPDSDNKRHWNTLTLDGSVPEEEAIGVQVLHCHAACSAFLLRAVSGCRASGVAMEAGQVD